MDDALTEALAVLERLGEAALLVDEDRILSATTHATGLLGYSDEELRSMPTALVLAPPHERAELSTRMLHAQSGRPSASHVETRVLTKDGRTLRLDVTVTASHRPEEPQRLVVLRALDQSSTVARDVARRILESAANGAAREATLRTLGREVARQLDGSSIPHSLRAFVDAGLGSLRLASQDADRYVFEGRELLDRAPTRGTCFLTLSFLESIVSFNTHREALGTEMACQSRGDETCGFVVRSRTAHTYVGALTRPIPHVP